MVTGRNRMDAIRPLRRLLDVVEVPAARRFGRSPLSVLFRTPVLVLETVGRRSGRIRETTVAYHRLPGGELVVVGGAGGQRRTPDWVANLRAEPHVGVVVGRRRRSMVAEELVGEERRQVWKEVRGVWPRIDAYERRAGRPVPVFRLTRRRSSCRTPRGEWGA